MQLNSLGRRIQMLRESNMMTKTDLAQVLGVTRKELVEWEEGRAVPKAKQIVELARYFSVDPRSLVEDPAEAAQTQARIEAEQKTVSGKKLVLAVFGLIVGLVILAGSVLVLYSMGAAGDLQESAAKSEEAAPLPEYLALEEVELAAWDLDGDGEAEQVNPAGEDILLIRDGKAYALAEPLAKGQKLTAQDGVFIVKNAAGESRIYSRLRDEGIWPAG